MKVMGLILKKLWCAVIGFISPVWLATTYACLTGSIKGVGVDLGSEKDIIVFFGIVFLLIWISAMVPIICWTVKSCKMKQKALPYIYWSVFLLAGALQLIWVYLF